MAKPRPSEPNDSFTIRPPETVGSMLRQLAAASGVPINTYLVAILTDAAIRQLRIEEKVDYIVHEGPMPPQPTSKKKRPLYLGSASSTSTRSIGLSDAGGRDDSPDPDGDPAP